jgi:hypothetical protein
MSQLRGKPFLVMSITEHPKEGVDTSQKGWMLNPINIVRKEHVCVVDRITRKYERSHLIIDILDRKVIRNVTQRDDESQLEHYLKRYAKMVVEAVVEHARIAHKNAT